MSVTKQNTVEACTAATFIEHQIAANEDFTGTAPALATVAFVKYTNDIDQVVFYADPTDDTIVQGDEGGLFTWEMAAPSSLECFYADLGSSIAWELFLVTRDGHTVKFDGATGRYIIRTEYQRFHMARGDSIRLTTTGGTAAMWARAGFTLNQGMR
jgi:hypothetical protein